MITRLIRDDRGSATVEAAIWLTPAVLVLAGLVQIALWWAATDTCSAAAQQGLAAGRVLGGTPADAQWQASSVVTRVSGVLSDAQASTAGTTDTVMRVSVSADLRLILPIPGLRWHIEQDAVGPREHVTTPRDF
jgi:hypothetical protein